VVAIAACSRRELPTRSTAVPPADSAPPTSLPTASAPQSDGGAWDRSEFRYVLVGKIVYPSERITMVLERSGARARLEISCQEGQKRPSTGISLDGAELDERYWLPPTIVRYAGSGAGDTIELTTDGMVPAQGKGSCAGWPGAFELTCSPETVQALAAGAVLIPGKKHDDDSQDPARWKPPVRTPISGRSCQLKAKTWRLSQLAEEHRPIFAASPLEWADENSDMVVQEGAYRLISRP
jgi:hypothetical protein